MSTNKRILQEFDEHCRRIAEHTTIKANETDKEKRDRIERARKDYRFFVNHYFPHYAQYDCADFQVEAANKIRKHPNIRACLEWFRGAAKSTNAIVFIPLWLKIQVPRAINVMVVVSKSETAAKTLLADLQAELQHNQRYIADFGEQYQEGSWEDGQFVTKDGFACFAKGRGQSPRGLRYKQHRPDYLAIDDIDDDELVINEHRVDKVVNWILEALVGAMDMGRGRLMMIGNLIGNKSVLAKVKERLRKVKEEQKQKGTEKDSQQYIYLSRVCALDENGKSTWPQKNTEAQVHELIALMGYISAQKELFHNPIEEGKIFKKAWLVDKQLPPVNQYKHLIAYLDGGFKKTKTSDSKALVLVGLHGGEFHIVKAYVGQATRKEMVDWHYNLDRWLRDRNATCIWMMEEVFLLDLLYDDFKAAGKEHGYTIPIQGDKRKKPDKDLRIEATSGYFERGDIYFNAAEKDNHYMGELKMQYRSFEKGKDTHKDGPDAVEGALFQLKTRVTAFDKPVIGKRSANKFKF